MTAPFLGSASGLTPQRLRAKRYRHLGRDLYLATDQQVDLLRRTQATLLVLPDAVACRRTAAVLQRLPVDDDGVVHLARGRTAARSERPGVKVHRTPVADDERLLVRGVAVTHGPRTFVDLAASIGFEQLVAVGDVVLRRYGGPAVDEAVERAQRRPGATRARRAAALLDPGSDSPAESRARIRLHAAGFTSLRHGVIVRDRAGGWLAAPDLADDDARVAVQHDGLVHLLGDPERRRQDLQRDELARQLDWQVVVATAVEDRLPHLLVEKVADAYRRAELLRHASTVSRLPRVGS